MSYTKQNFKSGDKLYASQLNAMDEQLFNSLLYTEQTLTEAQKAQARANIGATAGEDVEHADSVEWLDENGDTSKKYVLPDGYIYAWTEGTQYITHNANDGTCVLNARPAPDSPLGTTDISDGGCFTTAAITVDKSQSNYKVNLSGLNSLYTNFYAPIFAYYYKADGSWIGYTQGSALGAAMDGTTIPLPCTIDLSLSPHWASASQVRILFGITESVSISDASVKDFVINFESLNREEIYYSWKSTGVLHDYTNVISELQEDVGDLKVALAQSMVLPAESMEWLRENGIPGKSYVLPDGYIYTYQAKEIFTEYNANDGTGYTDKTPSGTWGNSSDSRPGMWTSPLISIDPYTMGLGHADQTNVTISGIEKVVPAYNGYAVVVYYYKQDGTQLYMKTNQDLTSINIKVNNEITTPFTFKLRDPSLFIDSNWVTVYGVRIALGIAPGTAMSAEDIANLTNLKVSIPFFDHTDTVEDWYSTGQVHSNDKATQQNTTDIGFLKERTDALESDVEELRETVENVNVVDINTGQVLYAVGDSITYGYGIGGNDYSWVKHVIERNGYDSENSLNLGQSNLGFCTAAMSGDTITDVVGGTNFSGADIVTVALGVNDWKNYSATLTDFWSGMEYCFNKIRTDNPYCKIFYILPFSYKAAGLSSSKFETFYALGAKGDGNTERPYGHTMQNFINMIKDKFEEDTFKAFHVHVIDMVECAAINRHNIDTALFDGLHPSAECNIELGKEIARRIALT